MHGVPVACTMGEGGKRAGILGKPWQERDPEPGTEVLAVL